MALSRLGRFVDPATTIAFLGPKVMALTRFPLPSVFTSCPSRVMALLLARKTSQVCWARRI